MGKAQKMEILPQGFKIVSQKYSKAKMTAPHFLLGELGELLPGGCKARLLWRLHSVRRPEVLLPSSNGPSCNSFPRPFLEQCNSRFSLMTWVSTNSYITKPADHINPGDNFQFNAQQIPPTRSMTFMFVFITSPPQNTRVFILFSSHGHERGK